MTTPETTWRPCKKVTVTIARRLTQDDFEQRGGIMQTLEGPAPFQVDDYLAYDDKGEFPIRRATLESENYSKIADLPNGWASYQPCDIREARQMPHAFTLNGQCGKAGDYQVRRGKRIWIVDHTIFETSYQFLKEE